MASCTLTPPPTGEERGNGNSEDMTGWHCGAGSQGVDKPLPHLVRSRQSSQSRGLPALVYTPHATPLASSSPFLTRNRIWLGETEVIFCLNQIIFLSSALANQAPSGPLSGTWRFPGKQSQARNQASAENWWQKLKERQKYGLPLPYILKLLCLSCPHLRQSDRQSKSRQNASGLNRCRETKAPANSDQSQGDYKGKTGQSTTLAGFTRIGSQD